MGKKLIINMKDFRIRGDVLDISKSNTGIIYNISKETESELSIDYVDSENRGVLKRRLYDACTFFFNLNSIWSNRGKENIIKEVTNYLKDEGRIFIWDVRKERGSVVDNTIQVVLPNDKIKEVNFKNYNPLNTCFLEEVKKILEKYYEIEQTKTWGDIFFIMGKKKNKLKKEG